MAGNTAPTKLIWRILQLWKLYAAMDLAFVAADIRLAFVYLATDLITSISFIAGMLLLAEQFAGIGPWSQPQVMFLLGYATTVSGLLATFFGYNVLLISRRIGRGQLDHTLIQPQPIWVSLLTEGFTPVSGAANLLPGMVLLLLAGTQLELSLSFGWFLLLALNISASMAIFLGFTFIIGSLAFWAPRAAEEISASANDLLNQLKPFPLDGLAPVLLAGLLGAAPVGFLAWVPTRALLGLDTNPIALWYTPAAALLVLIITTTLFRKGMHYYERTGSQRYSNLGHRS
jgi:ABC-2 type transport system permease protein